MPVGVLPLHIYTSKCGTLEAKQGNDGFLLRVERIKAALHQHVFSQFPIKNVIGISLLLQLELTQSQRESTNNPGLIFSITCAHSFRAQV